MGATHASPFVPFVSASVQILEKSHTQEEFIRGRMTRNPYSMRDIGQTMRDIKNKICVDMDLAGLLEDDFSMELLVADKIIKLDLDINSVYEQVGRFLLGFAFTAAGVRRVAVMDPHWFESRIWMVVFILRAICDRAGVDAIRTAAGAEAKRRARYICAMCQCSFFTMVQLPIFCGCLRSPGLGDDWWSFTSCARARACADCALIHQGVRPTRQSLP